MSESDFDITAIKCMSCGGTITGIPGDITQPGATIPVSIALDMMRATGIHIRLCTGKPA